MIAYLIDQLILPVVQATPVAKAEAQSPFLYHDSFADEPVTRQRYLPGFEIDEDDPETTDATVMTREVPFIMQYQ